MNHPPPAETAPESGEPEDRTSRNGLAWRRGFEPAATGLDCLACGARVGVRPDLTERHRRWHRELSDLLNHIGEAPGRGEGDAR